jgi:hypothetical protein
MISIKNWRNVIVIQNMTCLRCRTEITGEEPKYGLHPACFTSWFKAAPNFEFVSITQRSATSKDPEGQNIVQNNTSFYHGKFKKYSADLNNVDYIIKMREAKEAPELPEVEYLCNQIAHSLDIPVPDFFYINFYGENVFVTKNFIKKGGSAANLEHIHNYRADTKHNCEALIEVISTTTGRLYDVEVFLNATLFDALIGNHDRHGRNLGFVVTPSKSTLAPIYDNVSYLSLVTGEMLNADFNPTGRVATSETLEPSMKHYVQELKKLGYEDLARKFLSKVKPAKIEELIEASHCSPNMKVALKKIIGKRMKELTDGLQS